MAKVQLVIRISGTRNGEDWPNPGEIIDLPGDEAANLIASGLATAVDAKKSAPIVEKATAAPVETAASKGGLTKASTGF